MSGGYSLHRGRIPASRAARSERGEWRQQADAPPILSASPPTSARALRQNWLSCAGFERHLLPSSLCAVACIAVAHLALFESWWPSQWPRSSAAELPESVAGLKARNAQLVRENDELKKRLVTAGRDQRQYTGSLAGFDRHPLVAPTRGQSPPTTKPPRPAPRPTASRSPPTAIALAADHDFQQKLGAIGTRRPTGLPSRNSSSAERRRPSGSLLRALNGRPPAPDSLTAEDIWAPRGSSVRYTELKTSMSKLAFPYPLSMPDDWLREVLEFFPALEGGKREAGKGEGATSPYNKFLINFGGHYMPSDIVALAQAMDGAVGCAIDSDDPMTYASRGVTKHVGFVTLDNVGSLLKKC